MATPVSKIIRLYLINCGQGSRDTGFTNPCHWSDYLADGIAPAVDVIFPE